MFERQKFIRRLLRLGVNVYDGTIEGSDCPKFPNLTIENGCGCGYVEYDVKYDDEYDDGYGTLIFNKNFLNIFDHEDYFNLDGTPYECFV